MNEIPCDSCNGTGADLYDMAMLPGGYLASCQVCHGRTTVPNTELSEVMAERLDAIGAELDTMEPLNPSHQNLAEQIVDYQQRAMAQIEQGLSIENVILDRPAETSYVETNLPWLPKPNKMKLILSDREAPADLTRTAFMIPVFEDGSVMLAYNASRGLEIAGGHIEPGETINEAAERECWEEAGVTVVDVEPLGYLRMEILGEKPEGYAYPYPVSHQQFYVGRVAGVTPYVPNAECLEPVRLTVADLQSHPRIDVRLFAKAAVQRMMEARG